MPREGDGLWGHRLSLAQLRLSRAVALTFILQCRNEGKQQLLGRRKFAKLTLILQQIRGYAEL